MNECGYANFADSSQKIGYHSNVRPFSDRKTNVGLIICTPMSANSGDLVKIDPAVSYVTSFVRKNKERKKERKKDKQH